MTTLVGCEEDPKKKKKLLAEANEAFNQMLAEVRAETEDRDQQLRLLTERVLENLIRSVSKKPEPFSFGPIPKKKRSNPYRKSQEVIKQRKLSPAAETSKCYNEQVISPRASPFARNSYPKRSEDEDESCKYYYYGDGKISQHVKEKAKLVVASTSRLIKKKKKMDKMKANNDQKPPRSPPISIPNPPPPMPLKFKTKIESLGGYRVQLVTCKQLFKTDLSQHHDRLSMPVNQVIERDFLGQEYEEKLRNDESIPVLVIDPRLKEYELGFKRWNSKNSFNYVLNRGWNKISADEEDQLTTNDLIQVWAFRVKNFSNCFEPERLCFALAKLQNQGGKGGDTNGASTSNESSGHSGHSHIGTDSSSITMEDEGKKEDASNDSCDHRQETIFEAIESSSVKEHSSSARSTASANAIGRHEIIESTLAEKKLLELGARKRYVMNLKFRNVTVAKIETGVPVV